MHVNVVLAARAHEHELLELADALGRVDADTGFFYDVLVHGLHRGLLDVFPACRRRDIDAHLCEHVIVGVPRVVILKEQRQVALALDHSLRHSRERNLKRTSLVVHESQSVALVRHRPVVVPSGVDREHLGVAAVPFLAERADPVEIAEREPAERNLAGRHVDPKAAVTAERTPL